MFLVTQRVHVQNDNMLLEYMQVWNDSSKCCYFKPGPRGLDYCDLSQTTDTVLTNYCHTLGDNNPAMVNIVRKNLKRYNRRQVADAMAT